MKKISNLLFTLLAVSSLMLTSALAASPPSETEAPGQPFNHPTDDTSYSKDIRYQDIFIGFYLGLSTELPSGTGAK